MNFCPNCGNKLKEGLTYCPGCGFVFQEANTQNYSEMENPFENFSKSYKDASDSLNRDAERAARSAEGSSSYSSYSGSADTRNEYAYTGAGYSSSQASGSGTGNSGAGSSETTYSSGYMDTAPKVNVYGIISLICGIIGFPLFFLFMLPSILAVVFGVMGLNFAKHNITGRVTSIIGLILGVIMIVIFILLIAFSVVAFSILGAGTGGAIQIH